MHFTCLKTNNLKTISPDIKVKTTNEETIKTISPAKLKEPRICNFIKYTIYENLTEIWLRFGFVEFLCVSF